MCCVRVRLCERVCVCISERVSFNWVLTTVYGGVYVGGIYGRVYMVECMCESAYGRVYVGECIWESVCWRVYVGECIWESVYGRVYV